MHSWDVDPLVELHCPTPWALTSEKTDLQHLPTSLVSLPFPDSRLVREHDSFVYSFTTLSIQQAFTEHPLCASNCSHNFKWRGWEISVPVVHMFFTHTHHLFESLDMLSMHMAQMILSFISVSLFSTGFLTILLSYHHSISLLYLPYQHLLLMLCLWSLSLTLSPSTEHQHHRAGEVAQQLRMQRAYVWFPLQAACNPSSMEIQHFGPPMASALMCSFPHPHKHTDTHNIKKHTWHTVSTFKWPHLMWTLIHLSALPAAFFSPLNLASPWNQNTLKWKSPALTSQCS